MIYIGNHVSVSDGYEAMGRHEVKLGGNTFAFFPRNPRGGKSKPVTPEDMSALRELLNKECFGPLVVHGAYTMNLCSAKEEVRANSLEMITDDLVKLQQLPGHFYNFHPGSHTGQGAETGIEQIADALVNAIRMTEERTGCEFANIILLETMTGKGSEMGGSFEELRAILDKTAEIWCAAAGSVQNGGAAGSAQNSDAVSSVQNSDAVSSVQNGVGCSHQAEETITSKMGICLDTCHVWDAGYDIVNDLDGVLAEFDRVIGLDRLYAIHLNDSKNACGARKDRHEKLGQGMIGAEALKRVVQHPLLQGKPFILETPNEDEGYRQEIAEVREWMV